MLDEVTLGGLVEVPLLLGIGDAVAQDLVAALAEPHGDVRAVLVDGDVHLRLHGQVQLVEELEHAPDAHAIAVVAPAIDAVALGLVRRGDGRALADAVAERLDIDGDVDGQAAAAGPGIVGTRHDARVTVAAVSWQHAGPPD